MTNVRKKLQNKRRKWLSVYISTTPMKNQYFIALFVFSDLVCFFVCFSFVVFELLMLAVSVGRFGAVFCLVTFF
jgi:hypothetical protein